MTRLRTAFHLWVLRRQVVRDAIDIATLTADLAAVDLRNELTAVTRHLRLVEAERDQLRGAVTLLESCLDEDLIDAELRDLCEGES